jgi:erythromycin esterase
LWLERNPKKSTPYIMSTESLDFKKLIIDNSVELRPDGIDALVEQIGDAKYVLLGEASHGTHEYYTIRAEITKRLIQKKGFSFVAVEGDWPDCYRLNRYVKGYENSGESAFNVLHAFNRWPTWMWANWEIVAFAEWLKKYNHKHAEKKRAGFYGLDVYSLWESLDTVIDYLDKEDPATKQMAMNALRCFEPYSDGEGDSYAQATRMVPSICEDEVVGLLSEIREKMPLYDTDPESAMNIEWNAQVIVNAERYYRAMVHAGPESWNIRDRHMTDTLDRLMTYHGKTAKGIVWEHNTHIGDARATDMFDEGMVNVGQLVNEKHADAGVYSVGFGCFKGSVMAGHEWGEHMRAINMPDAAAGSWENLLHNVSEKDRVIFMNDDMKARIGKRRFPHRAVGVVYRPQHEHRGNYVPSLMTSRYNAFIYLNETSVVHALHIKPDGQQMPDTYPFGM